MLHVEIASVFDFQISQSSVATHSPQVRSESTFLGNSPLESVYNYFLSKKRLRFSTSVSFSASVCLTKSNNICFVKLRWHVIKRVYFDSRCI